MPAKSDHSHWLVHPSGYKTRNGAPPILRIEFSNVYTKVDFGYQTMVYYIRGGWVRIHKDTFLRDRATGKCYPMVRAENIPIGPDRHDFNTPKDWLFFSLFFPPIHFGNMELDLIEQDPGDQNDFNYFNIIILKGDGMQVK
jgi:hypothetical protein